MPVRNCKTSYDLVLVPSETSAAALYSEHVTRDAQVTGEGADSLPPGGERQGHLAEKHVGWKTLWPSLENAICHLQSLKVH